MEVFFVQPGCMPDFEAEIPVGTFAVIPSIDWKQHQLQREAAFITGKGEEFDEQSAGLLPENTLICMGQVLRREDYPELSPIYAETGGFYEFQLPDLTKKFIVGIDLEASEIQWGDGVVYYESLPKT